MVNLQAQYRRLQKEIDTAVLDVLADCDFIKGESVTRFEQEMSQYLNVKHTVGVGNGTDALQIALMALGCKPGDEVIIPAFTYIATAEVISLLRLIPVLVDVDYDTFNINVEQVKEAITAKTIAIIPVHLFGMSAHLAPLVKLAEEQGLYVIEDNAQGIGADYKSNGLEGKTGTLGHIGCTSFFPSKNLGGIGDGGALCTNDIKLAKTVREISNHGQHKKYHHSRVGVNSRLDTINAAVLRVKLCHLDDFISRRQAAAEYYTISLSEISSLLLPQEQDYSTHVYHQYTIKVVDGSRDALKDYLQEQGIPSVIYYPKPVHKQEAYSTDRVFSISEKLCNEVLSLPMHTELTKTDQDTVISAILSFYNRK